jgi:hypothetical protein
MASGCSLNDSELAILATLNTKLNLGLDQNVQRTPDGVKLIIKELINQKWRIYDLHEIGISLRSVGVICLKLKGFFGYPYNPFGTFGIKKESFIY